MSETRAVISTRLIGARIQALTTAPIASGGADALETRRWHIDATSAAKTRVLVTRVQILTDVAKVEVLARAFEGALSYAGAPTVVLARSAGTGIIALAVRSVVPVWASAGIDVTTKRLQTTGPAYAWIGVAGVEVLARLAEVRWATEATKIGGRRVKTVGAVGARGTDAGTDVLTQVTVEPRRALADVAFLGRVLTGA